MAGRGPAPLSDRIAARNPSAQKFFDMNALGFGKRDALYRPEGKTMKVNTDVKSGLVVIAIIAILIALPLPAVQTTRPTY